MAPWADCPFALPQGIVAKRDGDLGVLLNPSSGKFIGLALKTFEEKNLPAVLARIA